jgi:hypothetical protein
MGSSLTSNPLWLCAGSCFVFFSTHVCLDLSCVCVFQLALALMLWDLVSGSTLTPCSVLVAGISDLTNGLCMAALCPPAPSHHLRAQSTRVLASLGDQDDLGPLWGPDYLKRPENRPVTETRVASGINLLLGPFCLPPGS